MQWLARHRMGVLGFTVMVAYLPHLLSPAAAPRWAVLAIALPLLFRPDPRDLRPEALLLLLWTAGLCALSLCVSPDPMGGAFELMQFAILAMVGVAAASSDNLDDLMAGVGLGLAVNALVGLTQFVGYPIPGVEQTGSAPAGLFLNGEVFAQAAALAFAWAVVRPRWAMAALCAAIVVATQSRVGLVICAAGLIYAVGLRHPWRAAAMIVAVGALAAFSLVGFGLGKIESAGHRIILWIATGMAITPLGEGLGWFQAAHPHEIFAHSDVLQALAELGWFAAVPIIGLPLLVMGRGEDADRSLFVGCCIAALVSFPLHMPASGFMAAACAGVLLGRRAVVRVGKPDRRADDELDYLEPAYARVDGVVERGRRAGALSVRSEDTGHASRGDRAAVVGA